MPWLIKQVAMCILYTSRVNGGSWAGIGKRKCQQSTAPLEHALLLLLVLPHGLIKAHWYI